MELILWRHAEAEDHAAGGDTARALTKRGRKQAERMAEWLRPLITPDWRILASPAKRAVQTVKPLDMPYEESEAVGLGATPDTILRAAGWPSSDRPVLVVGHQPTLGQTVARIVGGRSGEVSIRKGSIWWFETRDRGADPEVVLKAVMEPELLGH